MAFIYKRENELGALLYFTGRYQAPSLNFAPNFFMDSIYFCFYSIDRIALGAATTISAEAARRAAIFEDKTW